MPGIKFVHYDLGQRNRGEIVEVSLSAGANVQLLDSTNFQKYKRGSQHRYVGGLARRSPIRLAIPNAGHWYVVIDMMGLKGGHLKSSVQVVPGPLPEIREQPLSSVPSLLRERPPILDRGGTRHDVFISHASEDKEAVVRPLANALVNEGLSVWYDEFELKIGDSLRRKIDHGLANSRVGLVVLSRSFISKGWPNYELDGIVTRSVSGEQILLPIWHDISKDEVTAYSASLADKVARSTGTHTILEIAGEIAGLVRGSNT